MMMLLTVLAIGLGCILLTWLWGRAFRGFVRKTPTVKESTPAAVVHSQLRALLAPAVGRGADAPWFDYGRQVLERRLWLLALAVSSLNGLLFAVLPAVALYNLSMHNFFLGLSRYGMLANPPDWIFWLADGRLPAVLALAAVGAFLGLIFRSPYLVGALAWVFLFPGFLSLTGFVAIQLGERLGLKAWRLVRFGRSDKSSFRDWGLSLVLQLGVLLVALQVNPVVQDVVAPVLGGDGFNAFWRFIQAYVLLVFWVVVEVVLAMGIFHFYARRTSA